MNEPLERNTGVSVSEAARVLRVSPGTIRRRIAQGTLRAERMIRPQGTAWSVILPVETLAEYPTTIRGRSKGAPSSERTTTQMLYAPKNQDLMDAGPVEPITRLIDELAEMRAVAERRSEELVRQAETIGRQAAELEHSASTVVSLSTAISLSSELSATRQAETRHSAASVLTRFWWISLLAVVDVALGVVLLTLPS